MEKPGHWAELPDALQDRSFLTWRQVRSGMHAKGAGVRIENGSL